MPRYSLRTLIVVMLLGGVAVAEAWWSLEPGRFSPLRTIVVVMIGYIIVLINSQRPTMN